MDMDESVGGVVIGFCVGDLAYVDDEAPRGVWVSHWFSGRTVPETGHIGCGEVVVVLEVEEENVFVMSQSGVVGWTWMDWLVVV